MIPTWKINRELERIIIRGQGLLNRPVEALFRMHHKGLTTRCGALDSDKIRPGVDVAIFALYQPRGLSESTFFTLRHLREQGYAPIVVSNAQLTDCDVSRLRQHAIIVYERKNFGYDIGAFQDVIRSLPGMGASLKSLVLINDSIWFPVKANAHLIEQMKTHPASAVAAQMFENRSRASASSTETVPILGSYLMMFKQDALASTAFQGFWRNYRMSSNKEITIRRGERGLSSALHQAGISMGGVYSLDQFDAALSRSSKADLLDGLENMILLKSKDRARRFELLAQVRRDDHWEDEVRSFMRTTAKRKNITSVHPVFCINKMGVEIVKKNNEMHYRLARQCLSNFWSGASCMSRPQPFQNELDTMTAQDVLPNGLYTLCREGGAGEEGQASVSPRATGWLKKKTVLPNSRFSRSG